MKTISTPQFRIRTDGVKFTAPPSAHNFLLSNTRFSDEKLVSQITYTLDDQDLAFLRRAANWISNNNTPSSSQQQNNNNNNLDEKNPTEVVFSPKMLAAIMTAFEIAAYRELHNQDTRYQAQLQEYNRLNATTTTSNNSSQTSTGSNNSSQQQISASAPSNARTSTTQGALEHSSRIVSSPNLPGILEQVSIDLPVVLKYAGVVLFPASYQNQPHEQQAILDKIYECSKGHWLEKRKASGTALLPVLRPVPYGNRIFGNKQLGESDEPFTSREARNCQVLWRNTNVVLPPSSTTDAAVTMTEEEKEKLILKRKRLHAKHDARVSKKILNSAYSLMKGIVEREEKRLAHAEILVAELALSRKCRQLGIQHKGLNFGQNHQINNNNDTEQNDENDALKAPLVDGLELRGKTVSTATSAKQLQQHLLMMQQQQSGTSDEHSPKLASSLPIQMREKEALHLALEENLLEEEEDEESD